MAERTIDAVVFDYGGVLTTPLRVAMAGWLAADGIDVDSFYAVMREWMGRESRPGTPVHLLESGELPGQEFERELAARLVTVAGRPVVAEGLLGRLFSGMCADRAMFDLVRRLRSGGVLVGLLSNSWDNHYPDGLAELFDAVVISGDVGLRKPDPRIYRLVLEELGVAAERAAFVDDALVNVVAAQELGMAAVRHTDADTTMAALAELAPELAAVIR